MGHRAPGAWHRANVEPALFRPVQSGRQFSRAMRRSARRDFQSAAREFGLFSRAGGIGEPCDPRRRPRAGLGQDATGHFATGGSEANYTALICALTAAHPGYSAEGVRAFAGPVKFYTSRDCHIAWLKIAHQAGVGRSALRLVATDGRGRMDPKALLAAIADDRAAGAVPVMVVATAGTTGAGMIDPLHACADIAKREALWLHVDAAWGGAALASNRLRRALDGIERADSITIDAHKWLATTMGCAIFISRRADLLSEAFHASTSFMPSSLSAVDPYLNSVQWSRRFLGLRLFLALAAAGWEGLGAHVERGVEVIDASKSGCWPWAGASPTNRRWRCSTPFRRRRWATCVPWCVRWWPPGAPGSRRPRSRVRTWCGSARRTGKPAWPTWTR